MIKETVESKIDRIIAEKIPRIEMVKFPSPPKFDGGNQPHFGFFNTENGNCIQSFTAKAGYEQTTHDDYVALAVAAVDALGSGHDAEIKATWTETKSNAQATIVVCPSREQRETIFDIGGNDPVWPRIIIEAPFGKTFKFSGGFYRDACRNLSIPMLANNEGFTSKLRHTSLLREKMHTLIEVCQASSNFEAMMGNLQALDQMEISISEALAELYPVSEELSENKITRARKMAERIYSRIHTESLKLDGKMRTDGKTTPWRFLNAVTGYIQHEKTRKNDMGIDDRAVVGLSDPETERVWQFANKFLVA